MQLVTFACLQLQFLTYQPLFHIPSPRKSRISWREDNHLWYGFESERNSSCRVVNQTVSLFHLQLTKNLLHLPVPFELTDHSRLDRLSGTSSTFQHDPERDKFKISHVITLRYCVRCNY